MISKDGEEWVMAGKVFEQTGGYEGLVYNLEVEAEDYIGHSYRLNNGWFAHNLKPFQG
jgi:hypothetical protein